jgi:hypothetical protein
MAQKAIDADADFPVPFIELEIIATACEIGGFVDALQPGKTDSDTGKSF